MSTRKWLAVGVAVTIAWAIFASSATRMIGMPPPSLDGLAMPRPMDYRWTLFDLDDKPVDFAQFKGRPILLNIWATWCPPCLEEMPSIVNLANNKALEGRDVAFVCVSTDEKAETLRQFMKDKDWKVTVLRTTSRSIPPAFETDGIPATFIITPQGQIVAAQVGASRWDDPSVVAFLQKMGPVK